MDSDKILQSNLLDIVFEHRNKEYGAYPLRKFYNNRLYKAMGVVFMLALVLCLLSFFQPHARPSTELVLTEGPDLSKPPIDKPVPPKVVPPKTNAAPAVPKINTQAFVPPVVVPDNKIPDHVRDLSDSVETGAHDVIGKPGAPPVVTTNPPGTGDPGPAVVPAARVDPITPVETAEIMPEYPGGINALRKFLEKNLENPQELDAGQSISVKIRFIVGYDGKLKGFETAQDGGTAFNNEVVRVLKKMPQWIPGKTRGENVSVYYVLPVKFMSTE